MLHKLKQKTKYIVWVYEGHSCWNDIECPDITALLRAITSAGDKPYVVTQPLDVRLVVDLSSMAMAEIGG